LLDGIGVDGGALGSGRPGHFIGQRADPPVQLRAGLAEWLAGGGGEQRIRRQQGQLVPEHLLLVGLPADRHPGRRQEGQGFVQGGGLAGVGGDGQVGECRRLLNLTLPLRLEFATSCASGW